MWFMTIFIYHICWWILAKKCLGTLVLYKPYLPACLDHRAINVVYHNVHIALLQNSLGYSPSLLFSRITTLMALLTRINAINFIIITSAFLNFYLQPEQSFLFPVLLSSLIHCWRIIVIVFQMLRHWLSKNLRWYHLISIVIKVNVY